MDEQDQKQAAPEKPNPSQAKVIWQRVVAVWRAITQIARHVDNGISGTFNVFKTFLKALIIVAVAGACIWFFFLRSDNSSLIPGTGGSPTASSEGVSTVPKSTQPDPNLPSPLAAQPTTEIAAPGPGDLQISQQMILLEAAYQACSTAVTSGYANDANHATLQEAVTECEQPENLSSVKSPKPISHPGFSYGTSLGQVEIENQVVNLTVKSNGVETSRPAIRFTITGHSTGGDDLTLVGGDTSIPFITNSDNQAVYWLDSGLLPPCSAISANAICLVQPTHLQTINGVATSPDQWSGVWNCSISSGECVEKKST